MNWKLVSKNNSKCGCWKYCRVEHRISRTWSQQLVRSPEWQERPRLLWRSRQCQWKRPRVLPMFSSRSRARRDLSSSRCSRTRSFWPRVRRFAISSSPIGYLSAASARGLLGSSPTSIAIGYRESEFSAPIPGRVSLLSSQLMLSLHRRSLRLTRFQLFARLVVPMFNRWLALLVLILVLARSFYR